MSRQPHLTHPSTQTHSYSPILFYTLLPHIHWDKEWERERGRLVVRPIIPKFMDNLLLFHFSAFLRLWSSQTFASLYLSNSHLSIWTGSFICLCSHSFSLSHSLCLSLYSLYPTLRIFIASSFKMHTATLIYLFLFLTQPKILIIFFSRLLLSCSYSSHPLS